uniref:NADH dehydrogenase subunit 4 n=1 Tax=Agapetus zniachtl TaxID=1875106 RepID=UPI0022DCDE33|nr:NADH dehydrogenase subunit 4 [Agapetus zniachtl]UZZ43735.1 NADH dehydrogenase subunit 4 [Agapetus zniachtl]
MMKFFFYLIFMILSIFFFSSYWMVHMFLFFFFFLFMYMNFNFNIYTEMSYIFGIDSLSLGLILLSVWISALMILVSQKIYLKDFYSKLFCLNVLLLLLFLFGTFSSLNLFMFYLFFEGSLIFILLLIVGWGYQPERVQAGIYLLFYTLFVSLPMLMGIFYIYSKFNSLNMYIYKDLDINYYLFYFVMIIAFLVKMPMFMVHLWLPKAHVEAPVSGSMMLAGVMLKLGGYGIIRVMKLMLSISLIMNISWVTISLVGGFFISLLCFTQVDMKSLVAYSSVVHMSMVLSGLMTLSCWGYFGAYVLMIGHGLCSSGLFSLINIMYERLMSRSLFINKGLLIFMPSMSLWWFLLLSANMAAPPTLNLLGEISLINSLINWSWVSMIMIMLISFFSAGYSLYLYSYVQYGDYSFNLLSCVTGFSREYLVMFLHWFPLNLLILKVNMMII